MFTDENLRKNDDITNEKMEMTLHIPHTQVVMAFVATCIEATARHLGKPYKEVFTRLKMVGMIENYILPCYETLHTESRENVVANMIECLENWEKKAV